MNYNLSQLQVTVITILIGRWPLGGGLLGALPEAIKINKKIVWTPPRGVDKQKNNIREGGYNFKKKRWRAPTGNKLFE